MVMVSVCMLTQTRPTLVRTHTSNPAFPTGYGPTCNCSNSRPVELCALKSYASLSTPLAVSPASGSASLAELSDATTLSRRSSGFLYWPLGLSSGATGVLLDQLGGTAAPPATCG